MVAVADTCICLLGCLNASVLRIQQMAGDIPICVLPQRRSLASFCHSVSAVFVDFFELIGSR